MKYLPFLELDLIHGYYRDERCPDFQIVPSSSTARLLKNHRCILRTNPHSVRILMSVDETNAPSIPISDGEKFGFHLILQNADFPLFTRLDAFNQVTAPVFTNKDDTRTLSLVTKEAYQTDQFIVTQPAPDARYVLYGNPLNGATLADFVITGLGSVTTLSDYQATTKSITVNTASATKGNPFQITYPTRPERVLGVFAEVDITYSAAWPPIMDGPKVFEIVFEAKVAYWKYYVIADNSHTQFQIVDQAPDSLTFSDSNRTDLNQNPDASDVLAASLAQRYPDKERLRFVSDNPVPCQQQPRKAIQLRLAANLILDALPNPSLHNFDVVTVSDGGDTQPAPALYQIVRYFVQ